MEKKWILGFLIISLIILSSMVFLGYSEKVPAVKNENSLDNIEKDSDIAGPLSHQIEMKSSLPENQQKILIYRTNPPIVNEEITLALAKKFNVTGKMIGNQGVQSEDLRYSIWTNKKSGAIEYEDAERPNDVLDPPAKLPSDEDAVKIATQFLKERDLLPAGAYFGGTEREYATGTDKNGNQIRHNGVIVVWFGRMLNNLKVQNTQLSVEIGGNGDVIRYYANWRNYTPSREYPLTSPDVAFGELKKEGIATGLEQPGSVSIDSVYLAYKTKASAYDEEYLEPVWVFKGQATSKDLKNNPVTGYVPALSDESIQSLSS